MYTNATIGTTKSQGTLAQSVAKVTKTPTKRQGLYTYEVGISEYRNAKVGERNTLLCKLATFGRSLELSGVYFPGDTQAMLLQASWENGYTQDEGEAKVRDIITRARTHSEETYDPAMVSGGSNNQGIVYTGDGSPRAVCKSYTTIVSTLLSQTLPLLSQTSLTTPASYIAQQIYNSPHSANTKSVGYYILAWLVSHRYISAKLSARAIARATGLSKDTCNRAMGVLGRDSEIALVVDSGHGTDEKGKIGKTGVVTMVIHDLPDEPLENPPVDLKIYAERAIKTDEYITTTREENLAKRRNHRKETGTTNAEAVPVVPPVRTPPLAPEKPAAAAQEAPKPPRISDADLHIQCRAARDAGDKETHAKLLKELMDRL